MNKLHTVSLPEQSDNRPARGDRHPGPALAISLLLHAIFLGVLLTMPRPDIAHWTSSSTDQFTLHFPNNEESQPETPDSPAPTRPVRKAIRKPHAVPTIIVTQATLPLPTIPVSTPAQENEALLLDSFGPSMDLPHAKPERVDPGNQSKPPASQTSSPAKATVAARPVKTRAPAYPDLALERSYEGTSVFIATIKANGIVESLQLSKPSGHPILDRAAEKALQHWKFAPATRNGVPVDSQLRIPIVFRLS